MSIWTDFPKTPLPQLLTFVVDNRGKTVPLSEDGNHKLIATNCIRNENLYPTYEKIRWLSQNTYNSWFRAHPVPGDILFVCKGTPGRVCMVPDPIDFCIAQDMVALRTDESKVYNRYLLAVLRSKQIQEQISNTSVGDVIPHFKKKFFDQLLIPMPPLDLQKRIGDLYFCFSVKIENNKQINENLQQQAFALFERLLSHSEGDLCMLSEIAEINPKRQLAKGIVARYIDMAQLSTSGAFPSGWEMKPYNGGMRFSNGDTIIARITPCLENGKTAFIDFLNDSEVAFGSTEYIVLATKGIYPAEFFYCLARYPAFVDYAVKNMNGSSGRQRVSADTLGKYLLPRVSEEEISMFRDRVTILFKSMRNNSLENMRLSALRDALLPKLMSGELDVSGLDL